MLREAQGNHQETMQQSEHGSYHGSDGYAEPQVSAQEDGEPAGKGTRRHDAFNAEVQNTGTLADEFAEGSENERRGYANGCGPERCGEENFNRFHVHLHLTR